MLSTCGTLKSQVQESLFEADHGALEQPDSERLAEAFHYLRENPVNINSADAKELMAIPFLNSFQVFNLLQYRKQSGTIYSHYELMEVKGFDQEKILQILPLIDFSRKQESHTQIIKKIQSGLRHEAMLSSIVPLELKRAHKPGSAHPYLGGPNAFTLRWKAQYGNLFSMNITTQQDAGEPFVQSGSIIDFTSGHIALKNTGKLKTIIIGDYHAGFGQGLNLWTGFGYGKSSQVMGVKKYPQGLTPFSGTEENRFLRGLALQYRWGNIDSYLLYSTNEIDASLKHENGSAVIASLPQTGLHRSAREIANKDQLSLRTIGLHLTHKSPFSNLGLSWVRHDLEHPFPDSSRPKDLFDPKGKSFHKISVDHHYLFHKANLYGEIALAENLSWGMIQGIEFTPADGLFLTWAYRKYQGHFQNILSAPFSESSRSREQGFYLGSIWTVFPGTSLSSYIDIYQFPRFADDRLPSGGRDLFFHLETKWDRNTRTYLRFKHEQQTRSKGGTSSFAVPATNSLRLHSDLIIDQRNKIAGRVEFRQIGNGVKRGLLWFVDFRHQLNDKLKFDTRYGFMNSNDFEARIYAYEIDLFRSFGINSYYGISSRFYLKIAYKTNNRLYELKYENTTFYDRENISSGANEIEGSSVNNIKLLVRFKWTRQSRQPPNPTKTPDNSFPPPPDR